MKFYIKEAEYIVFLQLNLDSEYWELEGKPSTAQGFYAVYLAGEGTIYYRRFDTYLLGYLVSLLTLAGLAVWHRKDELDRLVNRIRGRRKVAVEVGRVVARQAQVCLRLRASASGVSRRSAMRVLMLKPNLYISSRL